MANYEDNIDLNTSINTKDKKVSQSQFNQEHNDESIEELVRRVTLENLKLEMAEFDEEIEATETSKEQFEAFANEVAGHTAFTKLHKNEVLFLDENNKPIGKPQKFTDFVATKVKPSGKVIDKYLYTPGSFNEAGFLDGGIAGEWFDYVQKKLADKYPERTVAKRVNVNADFKAAYNETDEPDLVAGIKSGKINSYDQIVSYFAEKPVRGAEHLTRIEYVQKEIKFRSQAEAGRPAVPAVIQTELRRIMPGLIAHESKFNAGLTSSNGAKGLAQIMPATWQEYKGNTAISLNMTAQLDVVGQLMSDNYHYLQHFGGESLTSLQQQFSSVEEFDKDLVVPLLVSAYNVGGPATGLLIKDFADNTAPEDRATGKDLFIQYRDYAQTSELGKKYGFGERAGAYVPGVYGNTIMLEEKYPSENNEGNIELAQN